MTNGAEPAKRGAVAGLLLTAARRGGVRWVALLAVSSAALAVAELLLPAAIGRAVDAALGRGDPIRWLAWCALLVAVATAGDALDDLAAGVSSARTTAWLRHTLLRHALSVGPRVTHRFPGGELSSRVVGNAAEAGRVATVVVWPLTALVPAVGGVVALALIDPWLAATFLMAVPVLVVLVRVFVRDASESARRYLEVQGSIAARLADAVGGARTIAAAGTADREARRVLTPLPELHQHGLRMWRVQTRITAQEAILVPLLEVAVLAVAGWELAVGRISTGQLAAAGMYVLLAAGLGAVTGSLGRVVRSAAAAGRVSQVLAEPAMPAGTQPLPTGRGRLEFRGVSAASGALTDVDLVVPAGTLVAVVGRSGSGKSLLAALAGRLMDPEQGEVVLDGVPLPRLERRELRRAIGYGFERPVLLGATVSEAIGFGAGAVASEDVAVAARAARAEQFIQRLPAGYHTPLAEAPMSGGEAQRLGLARAFVEADRLLILDDVAASLDSVTEHHISQVLTGTFADRTRLVVAHRVSTASRADLVIWLDRGRVRASGTHQQLWDLPGYRAVFDPGPSGGDRPGRGGA